MSNKDNGLKSRDKKKGLARRDRKKYPDIEGKLFGQDEHDPLSKKDIAYVAIGKLPVPMLDSAAGIIRGSRSGHKTAGLLLGSAGAIGAEDKNTGKLHLPEVVIGGGLGALARPPYSSLTGKAYQMLNGSLMSGALYGVGRLTGEMYGKWNRDSEDIPPEYRFKGKYYT